jgi:hypothetical protein
MSEDDPMDRSEDPMDRSEDPMDRSDDPMDRSDDPMDSNENPVDRGDEAGGADDDEAPRPLEPEERESVEADLEDLDGIRSAFEPQGAKGVVIACSECGSNHFYGWELLKESLEHMLETGEPRMHEPAYQPREDDYVVWDYGKGYVDALADAGLDGGSPVTLAYCPWCHAAVEPHFSFCPACGRPLAVARLYQELVERGMDEQDVRAMLVRAGFESFG